MSDANIQASTKYFNESCSYFKYRIDDLLQ